MLQELMKALTEATQDQKDIAKRLKDFFKKQGLKVRIRSSSGKAGFIQVFNYDDRSFKFPEQLAHRAHRAIGRPKDGPWSGNIMTSSFTMTADQWANFLEEK